MQDDRPTGDSEQIPARCPYGHELGPGRVLVGWTPCHCVSDEEGRGHRTYYCLACHELSDKRQTICYFPEHVPERAGDKPE